jgi:transcriptional regulator with XRE-family HTH domain
MLNHPTFGELVKHARRAAGLTQEALATRAGLSARVISDLERDGNHTPRPTTVQLLLDALALSAQEREQLEAAARADWPRAGAADGQNGPREHPATLLPAGDRPLGHDVGHPPLIGRIEERRRVQAHVAGEGPPLLVVTGEPGVGKTRLLHEAYAMARVHGLSVLAGTVPAAGEAAGNPVLDALRRAIQQRSPVLLRRDLRGCAWLVRALPELAPGPIESLPSSHVSHEQETSLTAAAIVRFLANIRGHAGALLILDNLGVANDSALAQVARLTHSAAEVPLRIIAACREADVARVDAVSRVLGQLAHEQLVSRLTLNPLGPIDSTNLLQQLSGGMAPRLAEHIVHQTGGVPFYLVAWARDVASAQTEPARDDLPWPILQSVRTRLDAHGPAARTVLESMAIADGRAAYRLLVALAAQPEADVLAALDAASLERLVDDDGQAFTFAYGVVRAAVESDMTHTRRIVLRRRLAKLLPLANDGAPHAPYQTTTGSRAASIARERSFHLSVLRRHRGAD